MKERYVVNRAVVAHEAFDAETVVINFERGTYFSLRESAPAIWELLQTPVTTDELLTALGTVPVEGAASVVGMLDRLLQEGCLLRIDGDDLAARDPCIMPTGDFVAPIVEVFHDLTTMVVIELAPLPDVPPAVVLPEP